MTVCTANPSRSTISVGMGEAVVVPAPGGLTSVLGSCVGVVLHHPRRRIGALAHVVLPEAAGRAGSPAKFADSAIPHLLELLVAAGAPPSGLVAKIAGGASMFASGGPLQVGESNVQAVVRALETAKIALVGQHVGGSKGRRISLDVDTGELTIEVVGCAVSIL
jgi:chemotaxis protein CheD